MKNLVTLAALGAAFIFATATRSEAVVCAHGQTYMGGCPGPDRAGGVRRGYYGSPHHGASFYRTPYNGSGVYRGPHGGGFYRRF